MKNVDIQIENNVMTIKVDLNEAFGKSSSGKSIVIASTEGNVDAGVDNIKIGLNVYKPVKK